MAIFKELTAKDFLVESTTSNQLVDVLQTDVSTDEKRKRYQNWYSVSTVKSDDDEAGKFDGELRQVFSGLFQTVHDINHQFQTANPLVDLTFGINGTYDSVGEKFIVPELDNQFDDFDDNGKPLFKDGTLMVREKLDIYSQMSQHLLGNRPSQTQFYRKLNETSDLFRIDYALFLSCKRLFSRDGIKRGTFAMRFQKTLARKIDDGILGGLDVFSLQPEFPYWTGFSGDSSTYSSDELIITDASTATQNFTMFGGTVGQLKIAVGGSSLNEDANFAGLIFYDAGIIVLDCSVIMDLGQNVAGIVSSLISNELDYSNATSSVDGLGDLNSAEVDLAEINADPDTSSGFLPINKRLFGVDSGSLQTLEDFFYAGTLDDIIDHIATTRFTAGPSSDLSSFTFQNRTKIKSMLVFINVDPGEFNYSNNPTYTTEAGQILARNDDGVRPFSYITKIGLYDADNNLLAVASLSRPVANTPGSKQLFRIRLDF